MSAISDGEPAFPVPVGEREFWDCEESGSPNGITIRDYFAAAALQGQLSCAQIIGDSVTGNEVALSCYEWADLMLTARKEGA